MDASQISLRHPSRHDVGLDLEHTLPHEHRDDQFFEDCNRDRDFLFRITRNIGSGCGHGEVSFVAANSTGRLKCQREISSLDCASTWWRSRVNLNSQMVLRPAGNTGQYRMIAGKPKGMPLNVGRLV
jgi:hypothetical protein